MALGVATKAVKETVTKGAETVAKTATKTATEAAAKTTTKVASQATKTAATAAKKGFPSYAKGFSSIDPGKALGAPLASEINRNKKSIVDTAKRKTIETAEKLSQSEALSQASEFVGAMDFMGSAPSVVEFGSASVKKDLRSMGTAVSKNFKSGGGWAELGARSIRGAAIGGAVGAGVNMVRGEDAWDGAARGAVVGGIGAAAHAGASIGMGGLQGEKLKVTANRFNQAHDAIDNLKGAASYAKASNRSMSKDVSTLVGLSKNIERSSQVTNGGFRIRPSLYG